jgi:hypothetical protein
LMRAFMDDFSVQKGPEGGADLVMTKKLPVPGGNNGDGDIRGKES